MQIGEKFFLFADRQTVFFMHIGTPVHLYYKKKVIISFFFLEIQTIRIDHSFQNLGIDLCVKKKLPRVKREMSWECALILFHNSC